jgi:molecular chaperone HtpG
MQQEEIQTMAKKEFKAESKRLLDLMINSIYTHKEIFLREIISNASDAIDKLCYRSLTDENVGLKREDFRITVHADPEARLLTVSDNGIGMSEEELENNLGVIASSGTYQFRQEVGKDNEDVDIIGQFGVGFYSAFMVADRITVVTKKYGEAQAYRWESDGADGYTVTPCEKDAAGTDIIMHVKEDGEEEKYGEFLQEYTLRDLVRKYSDYIRWPIRMEVTKSRKTEDSPEDKPAYESYKEEETLNSMVPLWQRKKSDVTREEYDKFYQEKFSDYIAPQSVVTVSAEGQVSYKALLYIPARPPYDYYSADYERGLQLYSAGVMIMDKCQDLIGDHFGFVKGVVDSPDLSLNISRELLQHDRQLRLIANNIEKKVKGELERMLKDDREGYEKFFKNFGRQLKVGCINNYGAKKDLLQDLLLFYSSTEKKLVTLAEYVDRMPESQKHIYYATGENAAVMDNLPQTELLRERNMEILYLTDQADQMLVEILREYKEKSFRSAVDGDLDLDDMPEEKKADDYKEALDFMKEALGEGVDEVRISRKLKTHPVCMTSGEGMSFEMERYFNAVQPEMGMKAKRILEVNVDHPAFAALEAARASDPEKAKKYAQVLMNQAKLIAGLPIDDPSGYTDLLCSLWS